MIDFREVCIVFQKIEEKSSRNEMTEILSALYSKLDMEDAQILSYLVLGRVAPSFISAEFNYSEKSFLNLLEKYLRLVGKKLHVEKKRVELGDIGDTVEYVSKELDFESSGKSLLEVYESLWSIVLTVGTGSTDRKNNIVFDMLKCFSPIEAKYFSRIVCGSLRFGINSKSLLDVFSHLVSDDKSLRNELDRAYGVCTDIGYICNCVMRKDCSVVTSLQNVSLQPGVPVLPRLVERVGSFDEVFDRFETPFLVQPKFDGLRCQIHKIDKNACDDSKIGLVWKEFMQEKKEFGLFEKSESDVEIKLFTRNLEDVTEMFPEIVESAKQIKAKSFILDSEALGFNNGKFLSFQETMQRRRKAGIESIQREIPMKAMTFDLLYLDGNDLTMVDTSKRIEKLATLNTGGSIEVCSTAEISNEEDLKKIFDKNVSAGYEGIIVKMKNGNYLPGYRNYEWIKLKKSMMSELVDTIDLVAVGYYHGSGRRAGLGVGAVLGALYNEEENRYEAICKVGTGFSDSLLSEINETFANESLPERPVDVVSSDNLNPDVWITPRIVFTVEADEISKRIGADEKIGGGLSLRFPRLVEWNRDKLPEEATSVKEFVEMKGMQKGTLAL